MNKLHFILPNHLKNLENDFNQIFGFEVLFDLFYYLDNYHINFKI